MNLGDALVWGAVFMAATALATAHRRGSSVLLLGAALALTAAAGRLGLGFATEEWALDYVADHTRSALSSPIRVAGLWAGAEGSLLLWSVLVGWAAVIAARRRAITGGAHVWAVRLGAGLVVGYGSLVALVASPFERSAIPAAGGLGLQPVLEHPAMVWHPPILYAGLVGLLIPAIRGAAGSFARDPSGDGAVGFEQPAPASLFVSTAVLTIGLVTGALWAGIELGWGGYWAWDPIESAGLVAWLFAAAAVHAVGSSRRSLVPPVATAALLVCPGLASLWATTLTRVGLVASVHAFADRPALRLGLLIVATAATGVAILALIAALQSARVVEDGIDHGARWPGRRSAVAVLTIAAVVVAAGAYEPLIEAATSGDAVAIAGHYYTRALWPIAIVGVALAVRADRRWWWAVGGAAIGAVVVPVSAGPFAVAVAAGGGAIAASALGGATRRRERTPARGGRAGVVAHVGVGLALVGIAGTVATTATTVTVAVDESATVAGMTVTHRSVDLVDGVATTEAVATVDVDGRSYRPRLIAYELRGVSTNETASRMVGFDEVQVQLVDGNERAARYRITRIPRVGLVWFGAALVALGLAAQPLRRFRANSSDTVDDSSSGAVGGSDSGGEIGLATVASDDVAG